MDPVALVLIVSAAVLVLAAEWRRLSARLGVDARAGRARARRRRRLSVVEGGDEDFAESVERDLANLPVIGERDDRSRR